LTRIVIADASVLINLLHVDRVEICARIPGLEFVVSEHVIAEVSNPTQSDRLAELSRHLPWAPNIWMGVSVEHVRYQRRVNDLRATAARIKFLSLEPLLGPLDGLDVHGIDWVIVGGESGPGARPMEAAWVRGLRNQCVATGIPFFFKQWGGTNKKQAGRVLDGRTWDEVPAVARPDARTVLAEAS